MKDIYLIIALRQLKLYWQPLVFTTRRGVLVSCGFLFYRLEEEYWFRAVFTTRRGVLVSYGFYDSKRSIGFVWFLFFLILIFFVLLTARAFSLEALHWRA